MAKRIVVIGGGTGVFNVLMGLKDRGHNLSAIVSMADDGGSTGQLRETFGILPPGDVRRALVALADSDAELLADLFTYRFEEGDGLSGHAMGNLLLTALERITGSFERAVNAAGRMLGVKGKVIPVTLDNVRLMAVLDDGTEIIGEAKIDAPLGERKGRIKQVKLIGDARPNPKALDAIAAADLIVIGPGDLYTSLLPNLVIDGVREAIEASKGIKAFIVNVMTKYGETDGFSAKDFADVVVRALGVKVLDTVIVNTAEPEDVLRELYARGSRPTEPVRYNEEAFYNVPYDVVPASVLRTDGDLIRHDGRKLAEVLERLIT